MSKAVIYHTGFIAEDRGGETSFQSEHAKRIAHLADRMLSLQEPASCGIKKSWKGS